jgi:hypothetical protein
MFKMSGVLMPIVKGEDFMLVYSHKIHPIFMEEV